MHIMLSVTRVLMGKVESASRKQIAFNQFFNTILEILVNWLDMTPMSIVRDRGLKELLYSLNLPSFSRETAETKMQG